jgi:hypothetical protein
MSQATRVEVYAAIDSERARQDVRHPATDQISFGDSLVLIAKYHARAVAAAQSQDTEIVLKNLRIIAALSVRSMEFHGAPLAHQN